MSSPRVEAVLETHGEALLGIAVASLEEGLRADRPARIDLRQYPLELRTRHATFVTLKQAGRLRGCMGSPRAWRPLVMDVAANAYRAGFEDTRFDPLSCAELPRLTIGISLLSPPEPLAVASEDELIQKLRPGTDGLLIQDGEYGALFLPAVWEDLPEPRVFLAHLKRKAGLASEHWSARTRCWRFTSASVSGPAAGHGSAGGLERANFFVRSE